MNYSAKTYLFLFSTLLLLLASPARVTAQTPDKAVISWLRTNAIPLTHRGT